MIEPRDFLASGKDLAIASCAAARFPKPINQLLQLDRFAAANPAFYQDYPALFREAFPEVTSDKVVRLSAAGFLYYRSIIMLDGMMDGESADCPPQLQPLLPLAVGCCQEESIKLLCTVFPPGSEFWTVWNLRREEYLRAYQLERRMTASGKFDEADYLQIADNKAAFGKIAIDVLYLAEGGRHKAAAHLLLQAHQSFSVGLQLLDDFQDFDADGRSGQFNYVQHLLDERYRQELSRKTDDPVRRKKDMYLLGIASWVLTEAEDHLAAALRLVVSLKRPMLFQEVIQDNINTCRSTRAQIEAYLKIVAEKVRLHTLSSPKPLPIPDRWDKPGAGVIETARRYCLRQIVGQANRCFPEIKHLMYLGHAEGFDNDQEVHIGDTFQRALLLDCIMDYAGSVTCPVVDSLVKHELDYLIQLRSREGVRGWSYFPTVQEIAPDTDDLGQVLQCLARGKRTAEIKEMGEPLVDFVAEHLFDEETGAFTTWLVPRTNATPIQQRQARFNNEKWGCGPDPEVVANLLYGVATAQLELPKRMRQSAETYLWRQRTPEGCWHSRWYVGPYYGTYVSTRYLIGQSQYAGEDYRPTVEFLLSAQAPDGSFGNVLSTSLALLSLTQLAPIYSELKPAAKRARAHLCQLCAHRPEAIQAHPFIIPRVGRPYGSRTLTIAYILKALSQTPATV